MHKIEFRAWDKKEKAMCWVSIIDFEHRECVLVYPTKEYKEKTKSFDEIELMQYRNLKDKNNKEIYEGDIVKYKEITECGEKITEKICVVECTKYGFTPFIFERDIWKDCWYTIKISDIEIIGNIYENPELLKEGKKT